MEFKQPDLSTTNFDYIHDFANQISIEHEAMNKAIEESTNEREKRYSDGVSRETRMIELLESIDKNTSVLSDMLKLLEENTQDQKAILEIMNDFNSLAIINDKGESQSLYRKTINKINTVISDVNTINTLCIYGMTIYNTLHSMGKI